MREMSKAEPRATGLGSSADQHDHEQIEFRFDYALGAEPGDYAYRMDAYLFVPRNVGVNRHNYTKTDFYSDVTPYMRLQAEPLPLPVLGDPSSSSSPLSHLAQAARAFASGATPASQPLVVLVKLYAYLFAEAVKRESRDLRRRLRAHTRDDAASAADIERELAAMLERISSALWAYRRVRTLMWPYEPVCHQALVTAMRVADEYMSLFIDERLSLLVLAAAERKNLRDDSGLVTRLRLRAAALAEEEATHRRKYGFLHVRSTEGREGEFFTYYASYLKKSVQNALYVETRRFEADDTYLRHAVAALGAALAATWAFATRVPDRLAEFSSAQKFALVLGIVLAYVLKDRIKAFSNEVLIRRLRKFDHKAWLRGPAMEALGLGRLRLRVREAMRFLRHDEAPPAVLRQRLARRTVRHAEVFGEEVIHYRKEIRFSAEGEDAPAGFWLHDIMRLNVRHFLVRLDDPVDRLPHYHDGAGAFEWAALHKVYHLNLVMLVSRTGPDRRTEERIEHLRVVLDKQGIVRIEPIIDPASAGTVGPGGGSE
jgi:hypothetical protein